jgi:hypothetical protein
MKCIIDEVRVWKNIPRITDYGTAGDGQTNPILPPLIASLIEKRRKSKPKS